MVLRSILLTLVVLSLSACNMSGSGQKGPFKAGSAVTLSKLDNQANPISSNTLNSKTWGSQGRFSISNIKWNGWAEASVNGQYFNEFTNSNSSDSLSLNAITKKDRNFDIVNIHLFSHLAAARIKQLVADGADRSSAWRSTQSEMKQAFGLSKVSQNIHRGVEQLSLARGSGRFRQDNANLLLFTGAFLSTGGDASALQTLSDDFADDGQFNGVGENTFDTIATQAASEGLLETLSQNLKNHGAFNPPNNGDMPELPVWVNTDGEIDDTVAPIITIGDASVSLTVGTAFVDDVTATDNVDGDITSKIAIGGDSVDVNSIGSYQVTYNISDNAGNAAEEVTRTVTITPIPDTTAPIISVGSTDIEILQGTPFVDDVNATDNVDGDITSSITITGTVDTNTASVYTLHYNVDDAAGNSAVQVTRTVTVILPPDTIPPVITLNSIDGVTDVSVEVNSEYQDMGATATDDRDGTVSVQVDLSTANTSTIDSTFDVIYTATDDAGNTGTETRTVTVVDTTDPVITMTGGDVLITEGTIYIDAGASATDNSGLAVTFTTDNPVDINIPDTYTVTYTATDTKGNTATATRNVTVEEDTSIPATEISGSVKTADGIPISGANITVYKEGVLQSQASILSDNSGNYSLSLESDSSYTLVTQQFGYATQVAPIATLTGSVFTLNIVMIGNAEVIQSIDPAVGVIASDDAGSSVVVEGDDFTGTDTLQLTITSLDTSNQNERKSIPGDLVNPFALFFVGLTEFTFTNESTNEEVNLAAGRTAEITIPIYRNIKVDGSAYVAGDIIQLYYLNEDTGIWIQEGVATVVAETNSPTGLVATATVSHFSWWSLSYPSNPAIVGSYATGNYAIDIVVSADKQRAFIATGSLGVKILDISDFNNITLLGSFSTDAYDVELSNDENTLYVGTGGSVIRVLDVNNPSSISSLGDIPVADGSRFELSADETKMFYTPGAGGLQVLDISTPSSPTVLSSVVIGSGDVKDISISSDEKTAFLAYRYNGLVLVDLTDLSNISMLSVISTGFASGIAISNDATRAYVSNLGKKLHIIDTSDRSNLSELSVVDLTDQARDVVISSTETSAYVASWESGLQVVDISDTNLPRLVGNINTAGKSINLAISLDDKHVFIADWDGGLQIIDTEKALLGDSIPPTITIVGDNYINHPFGIPYVEQGATATDDLDGVVTVTTSGTVDVNTLGSFNTITYTATDSSGNESTAHRTVYIVQGPETGNTIIDAVSGLEVQDNVAVRTSMGRTWLEAIEYCENLVLNNLDDWRLPNETDYNDIDTRNYDHAFSSDQIQNHYGFGEGGIGLTGAPNRSTYWTSFEDSSDPTKAFRIYDEDGVIGYSQDKTLLMGSRCVRN